MRRFRLVFHRFLVILLGYLAACLGASVGLHVAMLIGSGPYTAMLILVSASFVFSIPFLALFVGYFAFLPSLPAIAVAELFAWRRPEAYAVLGAAVAAVACLVLQQRGGTPSVPLDAPGFSETSPGWGFMAAIVTGGAAGGLAYWFVTARSSAFPVNSDSPEMR